MVAYESLFQNFVAGSAPGIAIMYIAHFVKYLFECHLTVNNIFGPYCLSRTTRTGLRLGVDFEEKKRPTSI